jgi:hypothetical protein
MHEPLGTNVAMVKVFRPLKSQDNPYESDVDMQLLISAA